MSDWKPFNGKSSTFSRVLEALIVAGIVAGVTLWGNSKVIDLKLETLCGSVTKLENIAESLKSTVGILQTKDATQEIRIDTLERRINKRGD